MDNFLEKSGHAQLKYHLNRKGLNDENFFTTEVTVLCNLLKGYDNIDRFVISYIQEKSEMHNKNEKIPDQKDQSMEVDDFHPNLDIQNLDVVIEQSAPSTQNKHSDVSDVVPSATVIDLKEITKSNTVNGQNVSDKDVDFIKTNVTEGFEFVQNRMFHFLNDEDNIDGKIVLGKYKLDGILDMARLNHNLIQSEFSKHPVNYKIKSSKFLEWHLDFKQLFPSVDVTLFFSPYKYIAYGESIGARGAVYNHYKCERMQLRGAGLLQNNGNPRTSDNLKDIDCPHPWKCLTDQDRTFYTETADILNTWTNSFPERIRLIIPPHNSKEKPASIESYLETFQCLCPPLGISLLEVDYNKLAEQKIQEGEYPESLRYYKTVFSSNWPQYATKVIEIVRSGTTKDCKHFASEIQNIIIDETNVNSISLLALPWCIKSAAKSVKVTSREDCGITTRTENVKKSKVCDCFILHIEDGNELENKRLEHEQWRKCNNLTVLPYTIFCGPLKRISQIYIAFNSHLYAFDNPVIAVEACFKCLIALSRWPSMCDFVWNVIEKGICRMPIGKNIKASTEFIGLLIGGNKISSVPKKLTQRNKVIKNK